ncbi:MAG: gephyrin-like molybdotransferase Glp [Methylomonas sp.]|jgi:molybdopterin molybdotransferase
MTDKLHLTLASCGADDDPAVLTPEQARRRILDSIIPLDGGAVENLPLLQVVDRVLAENVVAASNVPPRNNSAMDGYALRAAELPPEGVTRRLHVAGSSFAGHPFFGNCGGGECIKIMTGAVVPDGLDTVIPLEHVELIDDAAIRVDARTRPGDNVRMAGEDIAFGQVVLERGRRINCADLGLLASLGIQRVSVFRRLRVAFFSTGDELRSIDQALQVGEIYDSNRYTLYAMLSRQHCRLTDLGIVRDDPAALRAALINAAQDNDVIITTGGVSVGEADYVRKVFSELGDIDFWKVAMKPGRPLAFGKLRRALFFGLPGNPVTVMVGFYQFIHPALQRLAGEQPLPPLTLAAVCLSTLKKRAGRTEFQRGVLNQAADGSLSVAKTGQQGSGVLTSMSRANCFIVLQSTQTTVEPGTIVMVQPFSNWR